MSKTVVTRRIIHFSTLIAAIIAGAFSVASVFAADPPELPPLGASCINGSTMSCTGPGGTCRIVCSSQDWQLCTVAKKGTTKVTDSYICQVSTYWKKCDAGSAGTTIEGKTCTADKWLLPAGVTCGNGVEELGETCDDGNIVSGDGCSNTCQEEVPDLVLGAICGNGVIELPGETCDDGNVANGDGCNGACQVEELPCGNGVLNIGEQCDSVSHCSACQCADGYEQENLENSCVQIDMSTCGNGDLDSGEECDGGTSCNNVTCECSGTKVTNVGSNPPGCKTATPVDLCGNGVHDDEEECDKDGGNNCSNSCECKAGFVSISDASINCKAEESVVVKKQCEDGKDNDSDGKKDYPADPGCSKKSDNSEVDSPKGAIKISEAEVFPVGFNPNMAKTKITYKLSGDGVVELSILDESGVEVAMLIDNEDVDGNKASSISWDGTDKDAGGGKIVAPGKYFFILTVKESADSEVSDTKTNEINVIYAEDIEAVEKPAKNASVSVLHNSPPKKTSGTGPEAAIYLIFPVAGYVLLRKKKKTKHSKGL